MPQQDPAGWTFPFDGNLVVRLSSPDAQSLLVSARVDGRKTGEDDQVGFERLLKIATAIQGQVDTTISYDNEDSTCFMYSMIELENKSTADVNDEIDVTIDDFEYVLDILERM